MNEEAYGKSRLRAAELPLMRVKAARAYVPGEIEARIREVFGEVPSAE